MNFLSFSLEYLRSQRWVWCARMLDNPFPCWTSPPNHLCRTISYKVFQGSLFNRDPPLRPTWSQKARLCQWRFPLQDFLAFPLFCFPGLPNAQRTFKAQSWDQSKRWFPTRHRRRYGSGRPRRCRCPWKWSPASARCPLGFSRPPSSAHGCRRRTRLPWTSSP